MADEYANQPPISAWKFIDLLKSPLHTKTAWRRLKKNKDEANLKNGVALEFRFPDPAGKLATIYDDFKKFLQAGNIATNGTYKIITAITPTPGFEEYIISADEDSCRLLATIPRKYAARWCFWKTG